MQGTLNEIDKKLDLSFYTEFRAALDIAAKAFRMSDAKNRKPLAFQAIQSFAQSEHIYKKYLDQELQPLSNPDRDIGVTLRSPATSTTLVPRRHRRHSAVAPDLADSRSPDRS
jgi:hypothetical protein